MARKLNYDYSKTLWMKMFLAEPDFPNHRSNVKITFEQALEIIRQVDNITQGITKIIYLVGWQGLGHDDCYPEMEVVNDWLKRDCDENGLESLLWLIEEAKKYHTVVSFHGNVADEYAANFTHSEFVEANAVVNGMDGKPAVIEVFNDRAAYKTSYKQFWESGLFKKLFDRFCEVLPVREAGTVHLDNFCIAESLNPRTDVDDQDQARNEMLDYIASLGIDVTSEYTYREAAWRAESPDHPIRKLYETSGEELGVCHWSEVPMRTLGRIPATWWTSNMTPQECIDIPPSLYSGRLGNKALFNVFYGDMHGENIWAECGIRPENWAPQFIREFCTEQLPYFYLNRHQRMSIEEQEDGTFVAHFSDGIVSRGCDLSIEKNGVELKRGGDVILPLTEDNKTFIAYSAEGKSGMWNLPDAAFEQAELYEITTEGNRLLGKATVENGKLALELQPGQAVAIKAIK